MMGFIERKVSKVFDFTKSDICVGDLVLLGCWGMESK